MNQASKNIKEVVNNTVKLLRNVLNVNSTLLASRIRAEHLQGGTTPTRLRTRSGRAKSSLKPLLTKQEGTKLTGGITIGARYLKTHFGNRGDIVTIKAKPGKALAIPLPAACTAAGVPRGGPRDESAFGNMHLFPVKSLRTGKVILFGQLKGQKGKNKGKLRSKMVPLFLLTKSVRIKKRIDTKELLQWVEKKIIKDIKEYKKVEGAVA